MILCHFFAKCSSAASNATRVTRDERSVDYLVLGPNNKDRKVSAESMTMRDTTFKWLQRIALNWFKDIFG